MIFFRSLHNRLLLALGLVWFTLLFSVMWLVWSSGHQMLEHDLRRHLDFESRLISQTLEQRLQLRIRALQKVAGAMTTTAEYQLSLIARDRLGREVGLLAFFDNVLVFDTAADIIADRPQVPGRRGINVADREYYQHVMATGEVHISEPFITKSNPRPIFNISVPIKNFNGTVIGVLAGSMELQRSDFMGNLQSLSVGETGYVAIGSRGKLNILHPRPEVLMKPIPGPDRLPLLHAAYEGFEGVERGPLLDGREALIAYRKVPVAGWVIGVVLPGKEAFQLVYEMERKMLIGGAMLFVLAAILFAVSLRWLLKPLTQLVEAVRRIGSKEALALPDAHVEEVDLISRSFNELLDANAEVVADLHRRESYLNSVLESTPLGVFIGNETGEVSYANPALRQLLPVGAGNSVNWEDAVHSDDSSRVQQAWQATLTEQKALKEVFRLVDALGQQHWMEMRASPVQSGEVMVGVVAILSDITEQVTQTNEVRWRAEHDELTGLLNRHGLESLMTRLKQEMALNNDKVALMLIDLDGFKQVNDVGGHVAGDEMLRQLAELFHQRVRQSDQLCRLGGDEFLIVMPGCDAEHAAEVAEVVRSNVARFELVLGEHVFRVSVSIGVTELRKEDSNIDDAIHRADMACYTSKKEGKNRFTVV
ncbi:diguanylate cyclase [Marinobacterium sp. AK62]|uniref:Diguanylate cyclase n=1 Tax=Marinobacterium alkalitolerans TaxID=1542925 RepID=A0ABS3Z6R6_9GAMM|nr:diguanylate cyclase [Marinobacterium alkalitolerans]MBP0047407.1 diguanylate cyclase [Marinobacterium alkalitolerans]